MFFLKTITQNSDLSVLVQRIQYKFGMDYLGEENYFFLLLSIDLDWGSCSKRQVGLGFKEKGGGIQPAGVKVEDKVLPEYGGTRITKIIY